MSRSLRAHGKCSRDLLHTRSCHKRSMAQLPRRVPFRNPCFSRAATSRHTFPPPPPSTLTGRRIPGAGCTADPALSPCRWQSRGKWSASPGSAFAFPFSLSPLSPLSPLLGAPAAPRLRPRFLSIPVACVCENTRTPGRNCSLFPRDWPSPSITPAKAHKALVPILSSYLGFILNDCPASPAQRTPRGAGAGRGVGGGGAGFFAFEGELQSTEPGLAKVCGCCLS